MSNQTKTKAIIALVSFLVIFTAVASSIFYVSQQGEVLEGQIIALEEQSRQEASLRRLENITQDSIEDRRQLNNLFLQQVSDSIDLLNLIEDLAPQVGISLTTEDLTQISETGSNAEWVEVIFNFSGSRGSIEKFIEMLENVQYVSEVTSVSLAARSSTLWNAEVTMRVRLDEYVQ